MKHEDILKELEYLRKKHFANRSLSRIDKNRMQQLQSALEESEKKKEP